MFVIAFATFVPAPCESEVTVNANDWPAALWVRKVCSVRVSTVPSVTLPSAS